MHFTPPFSTSARLQTALTRKFVQVSFQATTELRPPHRPQSNNEAAGSDLGQDEDKPFGLAHQAIEFDQDKTTEAVRKAFTFKSVNHPSEIMVRNILAGIFRLKPLQR